MGNDFCKCGALLTKVGNIYLCQKCFSVICGKCGEEIVSDEPHRCHEVRNEPMPVNRIAA